MYDFRQCFNLRNYQNQGRIRSSIGRVLPYSKHKALGLILEVL